jgi:hypothetical protein
MALILVVSEKLSLSFLLQHQGRFLITVRTATEALRTLRDHAGSIQGVILDDRIPSSRLVISYVRTHSPHVKLCSWAMAERNSPFRQVKEEPQPQEIIYPPLGYRKSDPLHYVWKNRQAT